MVERRGGRMPHFIYKRADPFDARGVIRLAKINRAADLRVHLRAAKLLGGRFLADGRLHEGGRGKKKPAAFGHQDVVAHHREVRPARDAHAHNRGDLGNTHRAYDGVVAKYAAEIVGVRENVLLQREKNTGGIHEVQNGDSIFDRDILSADDFLGGHRKKRARFYGCVICDDHYKTACHTPEACNGARSRRAAPFLVHFMCGVKAQLE